jgi:branched-chain amino acid aminotransferase
LPLQLYDYAWFDGKVIPTEKASVPILTHALHYGTAVFEGIRGYKSHDGQNITAFRLQDHMARLLQSAKIVQINCKFTEAQLSQAVIDLLKYNSVSGPCYVRPILFVGFSGINLDFMGFPTHVGICAFPFDAYFDPSSSEGLNVCTSSWRRFDNDSTSALAKVTGNYINSVLAKVEAGQRGCDEAILLKSNGIVAEGTGENVFIVRKGKLFTPSVSASVLEGITRDSIIKIAQSELSLDVVEKEMPREELYVCDELFLTGTAAGISPVVRIDGKAVSSGRVGPMTKSLQTLYNAAVTGANPNYASWLTYIYEKFPMSSSKSKNYLRAQTPTATTASSEGT